MTQAVATQGQKVDFQAVHTSAVAVLEIWEVDPATAPEPALRALCGAVAASLSQGQPALLAASLRQPVTLRGVVREVDMLVGAYPGMRDRADMGTFTELLAEELTALKPSAAAVHLGIRAVIRNYTRPPFIAEVLTEVRAQMAACAAQATLLDRLPQRVIEVAHRLGAKI